MSLRALCVLLRTSEYRGDHTADVTIVHGLLPGETAQALAGRLLKYNTDVIEIRTVTVEEEPDHG